MEHDDRGRVDPLGVAQGLRAVARADRRDSDHVAVREAWRARSYAGVLRETMWRGDRVVLHLQGGRLLRGLLIDTGRDFVTLEPEEGEVPVDVQTALGSASNGVGLGVVGVEVAARGVAHGRRGTGGTFVTFAARLEEYAHLAEMQPARRVVVAHRAGESGSALVRGELRAVAWDHVYLAPAGGEVFLPLAVITYIHWADRA